MKILNALKRFLGILAELVYVPRCASCGEALPSKDIPLCTECEKAYLLESKMLCGHCSRAHRMCVCRIDFGGAKIPALHVTAYDVKRSSVSKNIILNIKDNDIPAAFDFLAREMLTAFTERYVRLFERANVIITYIPRSERARRKAGHDQSEQLAMRIARESGAVFMPLFRNKGDKSQKKLTKSEREENALNNFELITPELKLKNQIIVIVDDIITTGASIGACASLAKSVDARLVIALTAAKTDYKKGINSDTEKEYR